MAGGASDDSEWRRERGPDIDRLRRDVRALRDEIADRGRTPPRSSVPRGAMIAGGLGAVAIGGAVVTASLTIDLPSMAGWATIARSVPTQAAVGIVERIFTVY